MERIINLSGKKIVIFGGSSGIGRQTAITLSCIGAIPILIARNQIKLEETAKLCGNNRIPIYPFDLEKIEEIKGLIQTITAENGMLDGMVYAAGVSEDIPIKSMDYKRFAKTFNINYFAFMECVRQTTKKNIYNEGYRIVGVSSVSAILGEIAHCAYAGSKGAMDASIRVLAKELSLKGICINTVAPSMIKTEAVNEYIESISINSDALERTLNRQYLGFGEPQDVANAICFLLSSAARFITGITLPVDGGFTTSC